MATVTGLTAARMLEIESQCIIDASIVGDDLILERQDTSTINAGSVVGPQGDEGPPGTEVPTGGDQGQILEKVSGTDYDFEWTNFLRAIAQSTKTASYPLVAGDQEDMVLMDSASGTTVTVPDNATTAFPLGSRIRIAQINTGAVTIVGDVGVTIRYLSDRYTNVLAGRGAVVELIKIGTDEWILDGSGNLLDYSVPWTTYTPAVTGTTSGPTLGGNSQVSGFYSIDTLDQVVGGATIRFGTTASPARGSGTYRLGLPVNGVDYDQQDYSNIGGGSVGIGSVHTIGNLHFNGVTPSTNNAVLAIQGGLFLTHASPAGSASDMNIHYHFCYNQT